MRKILSQLTLICIVLVLSLFAAFPQGNGDSKSVTLTYFSNGGIGNPVVVKLNVGESVSLLTTIDEFEKEGAFLSGWNTSSDGSGINYNLGERIKLTQSINLYAKWTNLSFGSKVSYSYQNLGNDKFLDPNNYPNGSEVTVLENRSAYPSFAFAGFNTKADGTGIAYFPGDQFTIVSDLTLYGQWIKGISGPNSVSVSQEKGSTSVKVEWEAVKGASLYKIYAQKNGEKEFTLKQEVSDKSSALINKIESNSLYRLAVASIIDGNESLKTISRKIMTKSPVLTNDEAPIVEDYLNSGSTELMSDTPLLIKVDKMDGLKYYYTVDGKKPTNEDKLITNNSLIFHSGETGTTSNFDLQIIAYDESLGYSPVYKHTFQYKMPKPESDIQSGGYSEGSVPKQCVLSSKVSGTIYYTLDGTNPTIHSAIYKEPIPLAAKGTNTIKAIAVKNGFEPSEIAIFDFGVGFGGYEWADSHRFAVKRENPRATFFPYSNEKDALANHNINPERSPYYKSLDGNDWKFKWVRKPYDRNAQNGLLPNGQFSFETPDFNDSNWDTITVPSCWTLARSKDGKFKYDGPAYCPAGYIWSAAFLGNTGLGAPIAPYFPPQTNQSTDPRSGDVTPDAGTNPVGSYRKLFTISKDWDGREIFINFSGVSSACYIWVNGHPVGYAEDRFSNKEFDITPFVKEGENLLAVQVFRWCSGSWIEDQDMNRHAGIFRSVYLLSRPKIEIGDFEVHPYPQVENNYNGDWNLEVNVLLREFGVDSDKLKKANLSLTLFDSDDKVVATAVRNSGSLSFKTKVNSLGNNYSGADLEFTMKVSKPQLWSAEHPKLYKLLLSLNDNKDLAEATAIRIGFREIKLIGNGTDNPRILINGSRVLLHGTNSHEIDVNNGYTVSKELIETDLKLMKQNNINAIRLSHYPHHSYYYELADEYGIYLMDEANLECHGSREVSVTRDLQPMMQDRQRTMFERDKNHASVVFWSTGNENYEGSDQELHRIFREQNTQWLRNRDRSKRPVHQSFDNDGADMFGTGYQYPEALYKTITDLKTTMLQTEYCHNMGNAIGVMKEYIDFFEKEPKTIGGFTWDWVDQEITTPVFRDGKPTGETYLGFGQDWKDLDLGGWWEDPSSMSNMGCNGLVLADRTVKPQMAEVRRQYQMIKTELLNNDSIRVSNKLLFTNTDEFNFEWEIIEDGKVIQSNRKPLSLNVPPAPSGVSQATMTTRTFPVPFDSSKLADAGHEFFLNVQFTLKKATQWAPAGYVVAASQMAINSKQEDVSEANPSKGEIMVDRSDSTRVKISGKTFAIEITKANGLINSYKSLDGNGKMKELFVSGPVPNVFRSPVDGEREAMNAKRNSQARNFLLWKESSNERTTSSVDIVENPGHVDVLIKGTMPIRQPKGNKIQAEPLLFQYTYTIYPDGEIALGFEYHFPEFENKLFPYVPEIGSLMQIRGDYENVTWYGRGPGDTYVNRKFGNDVGIWKNTVEGRAFMYPSPQDMGNSVETRWLALTNSDGFGLLVKGKPLFDFNANHYSADELSKGFDPEYYPAVSSFHPYQLKRSEDIYLRVIGKGTGVGGINSWGKTPLEEYRVNASGNSFSFEYFIKPVVNIKEKVSFLK